MVQILIWNGPNPLVCVGRQGRRFFETFLQIVCMIFLLCRWRSRAFPSHFPLTQPGVGRFCLQDFKAFKKGFKIDIKELSDEQVVSGTQWAQWHWDRNWLDPLGPGSDPDPRFDMLGIDPPLVNAFRRMLKVGPWGDTQLHNRLHRSSMSPW